MLLNRSPSWRQGSRPQAVNQAHDSGEQSSEYNDLRELKGYAMATVTRHLRTDRYFRLWLQADLTATPDLRPVYPRQQTFER